MMVIHLNKMDYIEEKNELKDYLNLTIKERYTQIKINQSKKNKVKILTIKKDKENWQNYKATCYSLYEIGKSKSHPAYGITSSGTKVQEEKTIAVDTRYIPKKSYVAVKFNDGSLKVYRADDTGSGVIGKHIDIYKKNYNAAKQCGVQKVKLKIIKM